MKVKEFKELSKIGEIGEFTVNGQLIKHKKFLPYDEKVGIVYSALNNSFDAESNIYNRIGLDSLLKYLIIVSYITDINFPKHKTDDGMADNVQEIVDICFSSGVYQGLIENIKEDYEHILFLLDEKIKEENEMKHFSNLLSKMITQISELDNGKIDEMVEKVSELDAFRNIK